MSSKLELQIKYGNWRADELMVCCPSCGRDVTLLTSVYEVPYFGNVLLTSLSCVCGFKHSDSIITEVKEPTRYKIKVDRNNLFTKVIRSTSGTIRIPELGIDIEPGPASLAFITNVEGVLARVKEIVTMAKNWNAGDEDKIRRCDWILQKIKDTIEGDGELTLVLEDPFGNSVIISDDAFIEKMTENEASELKTGLTVMELTGLSEEEIEEEIEKL